MSSEDLIKVFEDTMYQSRKIGVINVTTKLSYTNPILKFITKTKHDIEVSVEPLDTISAAINLDGTGRTCMLNMASETKAGGGVKNGRPPQEECLFRCTDLFASVKPCFYPLKVDDVLYTSDAKILKDKDYNLLETPIMVDCLTVAAINLNKYHYDEDDYIFITKSKIDMILNTAQAYGCDNLVLGAWGCGVFGNDPKLIATLFSDLIKYGGYNFKKVVFAVINDERSVGDNYDVFKNVIG